MSFDFQNLEEQFLYVPYYGSEEREGWIVNYTFEVEENTAANVRIYFVDKHNKNFMIKIPYHFSLLIEGDSLSDIEEYIKRMYQSGYHSSKIVYKHDTKDFNHLSGNGKEFLYVEVKYRSVFYIIVRDLKKIIRLNKSRNNSDYILNDLVEDNECADIREKIFQIHEYDIENEIDMAIRLGIRCGKWYNVVYNGDSYSFRENNNVLTPDLRILAYDIETMKEPLQFPDASKDPIMMISIKTDIENELIINRETVGRDVASFEYSPIPDYKSRFTVTNEPDEKSLIVRFIELIQKHRPHVITTYNGTSFDFPYLEKRALLYDLSFNQLFGFKLVNDSYHCGLIVHLDSYLWVKRDSYLPKGNQGLKAVTKLKLGYVPEEVEPEDMCSMAQNNPDAMAKYSVSDAVATYFLFTKFVLPHVYSLASLVPYPPHEVSCLATETLCEALLISEAVHNNILIPEKHKESGLKLENGYAIESISYVSGFFESLRSGIFRSDFEHNFNINDLYVNNIVDKLDDILKDYKDEDNFTDLKAAVKDKLLEKTGIFSSKGKIWHLDIASMYSNIILTNRLQPTAIVNNDFCIRCEYSDDANKCKRQLEWNAKIEFYPPNPQEIENITEELIVEHNSKGIKSNDAKKKVKPNEDFKRFEELTIAEQTKQLKGKIINYSKKVYNVKKSQKTESRTETVCQREIPFYVDAVKRIGKQLYRYKNLQRDIAQEIKNLDGADSKNLAILNKKLSIFSSLQLAHKCILDSFYGYVMKNDSRWHSTEMAAIVCNIGTKIIKFAKAQIEQVGIPLELDTGGIWALVPENIPDFYYFNSGKKINFLSVFLNYLIAEEFTNHQYQEKINGEYKIKPENRISFEIDGPYKAMFIPAALEGDRQFKKRYIILNDDDSFAEIKGFEIVRNGELPIIKRLQEELIENYGFGSTLENCYRNLAEVASKWLNIIYTHGKGCEDEYILELLTESKTLSKEIMENEVKYTPITKAATRMAEILGKHIMISKLKVDYVVSKYPDTELLSDRVIPTIVFKSDRKKEFLKKWCKVDLSLKELIDWKYYKDRIENNIKRLISIPAVQQGLENPLSEVKVPKWCVKKDTRHNYFDYGLKSTNIVIEEPKKTGGNFNFEKWKNYYNLLKHKNGILKVERDVETEMAVILSIKKEKARKEIYKTIYFDVPKEYCLKHKIDLKKGFSPWSSQQETIPFMKVKYSEFKTKKQLYDRLTQHISIKKAYEMDIDPFKNVLCEVTEVAKDLSYQILTTFNYGKEIIYVFSKNNSFEIISKFKNETCKDVEVMKFFIRNKKEILILNTKDANFDKLKEMFKGFHTVTVEGKVVKGLNTFKELIEIEKRLHATLVGKVIQLFDTSLYSKIPLLNLAPNFLDLMFLRALKRADTFCDTHGEISLTSFKTEICNPGHVKRYSIMFECVGSLLLSIVQYKKLISQANLYDKIKRKDFEVLHCLVKQVLVDYSNNIRGAEYVINQLSGWILKDSKLLSTEIRDVVNLIHQRFIFNMVANFKKLGIKIVFVSRNIFCIETDKDTLDGCKMFFEYLQDKIATYEGYELLCLRKLRIFEKLLLFSPTNYFYLKNDEAFCFSRVKLPSCYLKKYFSEDLNSPHFIYDIVTHCKEDVFDTIIASLKFVKSTEDVVSNCYKLVKRNEFVQNQETFLEMIIYCKKCGNENILRDRCIKCGEVYSREDKNDILVQYFSYYLGLELSYDSFCDKCKKINERVLYEICKCGGNFRRMSHKETLVNLISQLTNDEQKEKALNALDFYGILKV
ncbi:DNA polymerase epsilon catalytic subunit A [Nosema granulosis]|uniref:DNA polymerase epsilon catalytic subunit n=1 Tax=Nosema granulosis TaxID=83296 RepID=A0A9P6H4D1_9MICR|nr:DNA polymerase epsilon catalytic subunit A [Nosema granulosis]